MKIFTIGFTKKSAESFFTNLSNAHVEKLVDVRLNNVSQLAGFSKRDDLKYFANAICGIGYAHLPLLAPEQKMLDEYKKKTSDWLAYEQKFLDLMHSRHVQDVISKDELQGACLLCSEDKPHHCHRRLVAEYLKESWGDVEIIHL